MLRNRKKSLWNDNYFVTIRKGPFSWLVIPLYILGNKLFLFSPVRIEGVIPFLVEIIPFLRAWGIKSYAFLNRVIDNTKIVICKNIWFQSTGWVLWVETDWILEWAPKWDGWRDGSSFRDHLLCVSAYSG